ERDDRAEHLLVQRRAHRVALLRPAHRDPRNPLVELDEHEIAPRFLPFGHAFLPADDRPGPGEAAESRRSPSARQGPAPGLQSSASGFLLYAMVLQPQAPSRIW